MKHELEDDSTNFLFYDVLNSIDKKEINLPKQWAHTQINDDNTRLLIFFLPTCKKIKSNNSLYSFYSIKEVILKDDMRIQVNVLKQPILNLPSFIFYCPINGIDQLEKILFAVDNFYICCGANESQVYIEKIGYNEAFKGIKDKCQFCAIVQKSIHQKRQNKIVLLRKKYYRAQKLKKELIDNETEVKILSIKDIENKLKETNISHNELITLQEIIKFAKQKNPTGHRYNEEWILLCLLLHMKSPKAYNFLRESQILPAIRRYYIIIV
ncbi:hypothetical protein PUN28_017764 [Cardiocondyla obscurior]|uniref:Uncharacterized protein n=1 Tax=Cardiocondyla obscurior TaxID=286306 RepID=A0AAW2EPW1_9HYME